MMSGKLTMDDLLTQFEQMKKFGSLKKIMEHVPGFAGAMNTDDLEEFSPTRFVGRLLGMGDLKALMEMVREAEVVVDEKMAQRVMTGKLTMDDLMVQFEQMKKFGSLKKVLEHLPGFSGAVDAKELDKAEDRVKVYKSIIQSMTKGERENPERINASRLRRVALGSGRSEKDVRELLSRYKQMKALAKTSKGRDFRQLARRMGGQ